ncbi:MAG: HD domain-containing protein [Desulfarculus sp.]|nr:HD domain-containing protein [Desulfarculus sp.]
MPIQGEKLLDTPLAGGRKNVDFDPADHGMAPLALEVLAPGLPSPADLFLPLYNTVTRRVEITPACAKGDSFKERWRDNLLQANQKVVLVNMDQLPGIEGYFRENAGEFLGNTSVPMRRKRLLLHEMASLNLRSVFIGDLSAQAVGKAVATAEGVLKRMLGDAALLQNLSSVLRSEYAIYTHSVNVSLLSMAFARQMRLPEGQVQALGLAGMLHDLGRAKQPKDLWSKQGPLDQQEWEIVRGHPQLGYRALSAIPSVSIDVLKAVLHHHENCDGSGYPHGLKAGRTPMMARLLHIVDAFDAMTSERPHRPAMQAFEAGEVILEHAEKVFGQDLVPRFLRFLASPHYQ